MGITYREVEENSFLGLKKSWIINPLAATTNTLSSATEGGVAAAQSLTGLAVGATIFRSGTGVSGNAGAGKRPFDYGRRLVFTKVDNASNDLRVTVRVPGRRLGVYFEEDIAMVAAGNETVFSTRIYDELAGAPKIIAITAPAASDTLAMGIDAKWFGLDVPFKDFRSIRRIQRSVADVPDASPKYFADFTAAMVKIGDAAIDLSTIFGTDALATHRYQIEYLVGGIRGNRFEFQRQGLRFGS